MIGTRKSALAMWQANFVCERLQELHPSITFEVRGLSTTGDDNQIKPLRAFEMQGVFTKELDIALLDKRIDLAVHCVKDLPTTLPAGLELSAIMARGDRADVLVLHKKHEGKTLATLPEGSVIGTSALRRMAAIAHAYPSYSCKDVRGNLQTRLMKLDRGDYDALILAKIGLERMGLKERISEVLDANLFGYAVGQGALGIACREGDSRVICLLEKLKDKQSTVECKCERGLLRRLQGGCKVPIAVRSTFEEGKAEEKESKEDKESSSTPDRLTLWASVSSLDGKDKVECELHTTLDNDSSSKAVKLGVQVAEKLLESGAAPILKAAKLEN